MRDQVAPRRRPAEGRAPAPGDPRLAPFRLPALLFAVFLVLQAATAAVLFVLKMGPGVARVATFYRGDEASFVPAKTLDGLLLVAVPHLVAIPLVLFAAIHVVAWARAISPQAARAATAITFGAALAGVASGFLTRWAGSGFAWLKLVSFVTLEIALLAWAALLVAVFLPRRAEGSHAVRHVRPRPGALAAEGRAAATVREPASANGGAARPVPKEAV
jgi:hypothetical protein